MVRNIGFHNIKAFIPQNIYKQVTNYYKHITDF